MNPTQIYDRQFGQMHWREGFGWCSTDVNWNSDLKIELCLRTELSKNNSIPEAIRTIFETLRKREHEYLSLATSPLIDGFNAFLGEQDKGDRPNNWPLSISDFIARLTLLDVTIDPDDTYELAYNTDGGPLLRVFISGDLVFDNAVFD